MQTNNSLSKIKDLRINDPWIKNFTFIINEFIKNIGSFENFFENNSQIIKIILKKDFSFFIINKTYFNDDYISFESSVIDSKKNTLKSNEIVKILGKFIGNLDFFLKQRSKNIIHNKKTKFQSNIEFLNAFLKRIIFCYSDQNFSDFELIFKINNLDEDIKNFIQISQDCTLNLPIFFNKILENSKYKEIYIKYYESRKEKKFCLDSIQEFEDDFLGLQLMFDN